MKKLYESKDTITLRFIWECLNNILSKEDLRSRLDSSEFKEEYLNHISHFRFNNLKNYYKLDDDILTYFYIYKMIQKNLTLY